MRDILGRLEEVIGVNRIMRQEPLEGHVLLKKGGPAEFYIEIDKIDELIKLVTKARILKIPVYVFGSGADFIIPDKGIEGLVIKNNCRRFDKMSMRGTVKDNQVGVQEVLISAESGTIMNQLVRYTIEEGLEGLEYQLGLPGTVGGAIYTNAKYKNKHARDFLFSIKIFNSDGEVQMYTRELPYFINVDDELQETKEVILSAVFKLMPGDKKILWERGKEAVEYRSKL